MRGKDDVKSNSRRRRRGKIKGRVKDVEEKERANEIKEEEICKFVDLDII